jgi:hypothetical protein
MYVSCSFTCKLQVVTDGREHLFAEACPCTSDYQGNMVVVGPSPTLSFGIGTARLLLTMAGAQHDEMLMSSLALQPLTACQCRDTCQTGTAQGLMTCDNTCMQCKS